jgi:hypothetical protein
LRPVGYLQFAEDVGDVVAHGHEVGVLTWSVSLSQPSGTQARRENQGNLRKVDQDVTIPPSHRDRTPLLSGSAYLGGRAIN